MDNDYKYFVERMGGVDIDISVSNEYLEHHGIMGMKWGERNGPPYPLGSGQKSSREYSKTGDKFHLTEKQKKYLKRGAIVAGVDLETKEVDTISMLTYSFEDVDGDKTLEDLAKPFDIRSIKIMENNYLQHYGVLGMRWGVRHDKQYKSDKKKAIASYDKSVENASKKYDNDRAASKKKYLKAKNDYENHKTSYAKVADARSAYKQSKKSNLNTFNKSLEKSDTQYKNAINSAKVKAADRLYSTHSHKANTATQTASTGKTLLKTAMMGSWGSMNYNDMRSAGYSKIGSYFLAALSNSGNYMMVGIPSLISYKNDRAARKKS